MRNSNIAKRSVLGNVGVKLYVKNGAANLSIRSPGPGEPQDLLCDLCESFAHFAVKSFIWMNGDQ
jgi:hypothetical protein